MKPNIKGKLIYSITIIAKMVKEWKIYEKYLLKASSIIQMLTSKYPFSM